MIQDINDANARIAALEIENQRLRDELELLRYGVGVKLIAPLQLKLTGKETQLLGRLLKGGVITKQALMDSLYTHGIDDEPEIKIIDVFVCKIRKKIKPFGLAIETVWGVGYYMKPAMIEKFATIK